MLRLKVKVSFFLVVYTQYTTCCVYMCMFFLHFLNKLFQQLRLRLSRDKVARGERVGGCQA